MRPPEEEDPEARADASAQDGAVPAAADAAPPEEEPSPGGGRVVAPIGPEPQPERVSSESRWWSFGRS